MTEAEWLACGEPPRMLEILRETVSVRRLLLFTVHCFRQHDMFASWSERQAVITAEWYGEGVVSEAALQAVNAGFQTAGIGGSRRDTLDGVIGACNSVAWEISYDESEYVYGNVNDDNTDEIDDAALMIYRRVVLVQCGFLRDIFGNPFRPVTFCPSWRTSTTVALAAQMYESRDFSAMPVLADALQDAGCDCTDILSHCRGPGPHVRGCWVVDLVLGKE